MLSPVEEQNFSYRNITLEEATHLKYLASNLLVMANSELVQVKFNKDQEDSILMNGLIYSDNGNKAIKSRIIAKNNTFMFFSNVDDLKGNKYITFDEFSYLDNVILVKSIMAGQEIIRKIPYHEENLKL